MSATASDDEAVAASVVRQLKQMPVEDGSNGGKQSSAPSHLVDSSHDASAAGDEAKQHHPSHHPKADTHANGVACSSTGSSSTPASQAATPVLSAAASPPAPPVSLPLFASGSASSSSSAAASDTAPPAQVLHATAAGAVAPVDSNPSTPLSPARTLAHPNPLLTQPDSPVTPALGSHPNPSTHGGGGGGIPHPHPVLSLDRPLSSDSKSSVVWKHSLFGDVDSPPSIPHSVLANSVLLDTEDDSARSARDGRMRGGSAESGAPGGGGGSKVKAASSAAAASSSSSSSSNSNSAPAASLPSDARHMAMSPPHDLLFPSPAAMSMGAPSSSGGNEIMMAAALASQRRSLSTPSSPAVSPSASPADPPSSSSSSSSSSAFSSFPASPKGYPPEATFPFWIGSWNMGAKEMNHSPVLMPASPLSSSSSRSSIMVSPGSTYTGGGGSARSLKIDSPQLSPPTRTSSASVSIPSTASNPHPAMLGGGGGATAPQPVSPFASWIAPGYKLYVVGLQESISEGTYRALDSFFASPGFDCHRLQIPALGSNGEAMAGSLGGTVKVEGRGDGSFLYPKCTSVAVWVHRLARPFVSFLSSAAISMGMTQGSKGGAALALKIFDSTFVFMSVHLSSNTLAARRACYSHLVEKGGNALGEKYFQLLEQFHHVFILGDLNYRLGPYSDPARGEVGISAAEAVTIMQRGDLAGLLRFDELRNEMNLGCKSFGGGFQEPPLDFYPTYKKHEGRRAVPIDRGAHPQWVHEVYKTIYKEPWYKTGKTASRIPSWCDRILWHSLVDQRNRIEVRERHPLEPYISSATSSSRRASAAAAALRIGGAGSLCSYRSLENGLVTSDHSAVSCGFQLVLPWRVDWNALNARAAAAAGNDGASESQPPSPANAAGAGSMSIPASSPALASSASSSGPPPSLSPPLSRGPSNSFAASSSSPPSSSSAASSSSSATSPMPMRVFVVQLLSVRVVPPLATLSLAVQPSRNHPPPFPVFHPRSSPSSSGLGASQPLSAAAVPSASSSSAAASDATLFPGDLLSQCLEPKYVRVLFPAPFESVVVSSSPSSQLGTQSQAVGVSKQVAFVPSGANGSASAAASPQMRPVAQPPAQPVLLSAPSRTGSANANSAAPSPKLVPSSVAAGSDVPPLVGDEVTSSMHSSSAASSAGNSPVAAHGSLTASSAAAEPPAFFGGLSVKAEFRCVVNVAEEAAFLQRAAVSVPLPVPPAASAARSSRSRSPSPSPSAAAGGATTLTITDANGSSSSSAAAAPASSSATAAAAAASSSSHGSLLALPSSSSSQRRDSASLPAGLSASAASSSSDLPLPLPPAAPFHLLLKLHSSDDLSGQCCVALPRGAFEAGDTVECLEPLFRDGFPLCHPTNKQRIHVHFILALSVARS